MSRIRVAIIEGSPVYKLALAIALGCSAIALAAAILVTIGVTPPQPSEDLALIDALNLLR